jgi:hypothetical protein
MQRYIVKINNTAVGLYRTLQEETLWKGIPYDTAGKKLHCTLEIRSSTNLVMEKGPSLHSFSWFYIFLFLLFIFVKNNTKQLGKSQVRQKKSWHALATHKIIKQDETQDLPAEWPMTFPNITDQPNRFGKIVARYREMRKLRNFVCHFQRTDLLWLFDFFGNRSKIRHWKLRKRSVHKNTVEF